MLARQEAPILPASTLDRLVGDVVAEVTGLGPLERFLDDPEITDVMVNGPGAVWIERSGVLSQTDVAIDEVTLARVIDRIVAPLGRRVDRASPLVDGRLPDGSRVNVVIPPLAVGGPCLTIRRFRVLPFSIDDFCRADVAAVLRTAVSARANIVVSGSTGAGKTTLLNALAAAIPAGQRIVTIEDAAELRLPQPHVVRLESRPANAEGAGEVTIRALVRNALRMRPDRIVVGEVRGAEALDMLQAMSTGHDGSLSTCHANGPEDALRRLETMASFDPVHLPLTALRDRIASAIDLVVHVERSAAGSRRISDVIEVGEHRADRIESRPLVRSGRIVGADR